MGEGVVATTADAAAGGAPTGEVTADTGSRVRIDVLPVLVPMVVDRRGTDVVR